MNKEIRVEPEKPKGPTIMIGYVRNPVTGEADRVRIAPLEPGMIIVRCGKRYQVDAKGQQRRLQ